MITGIIVALPDELTTLTKAKPGKGRIHSLNDTTLVCLSGVGFTNATQATQSLIDAGATQLISWGCAGALSPQLASGQCLVTSRIVTMTNDDICFDAAWSTHIANILKSQQINVILGDMLGARTLINTREEKSACFAKSSAQAVDMESEAIARVAQSNQLNFTAIRAIADTSDTQLPPVIGQAMNSEGEVSVPKLLLKLFFHPQQIPSLINIGQHFSNAKKTLSATATQLDKITGFAG